MKILIFAPHPDDEVLGCGGTIIKHVKNGDSVLVIFLTFGEAGDNKITKDKLAQIREEEAKKSAKILGVSDLKFLHFPDGKMTVDGESILLISQIIREKRPEIIYLPHRLESHRDHRMTFDLVTEGVYRAGAFAFQEIKGEPFSVPNVLTYEVWTPLLEFNFISDITNVIEEKTKAIKAYSSQLKNVDYDEAIIGFNRYRGATTGKGKYCECFNALKISAIG